MSEPELELEVEPVPVPVVPVVAGEGEIFSGALRVVYDDVARKVFTTTPEGVEVSRDYTELEASQRWHAIATARLTVELLTTNRKENDNA